MEHSIIDCFMIAFLCGLAFGGVYELLRITRRLLPFQLVTVICDISFFIAAAFFVFKLSLYLGNYIRIYTLLGFGGGVFAYIQTVGRLISFLESFIIGILRKTVGAFIKYIASSAKKAIGAFAHIAASYFGKINDFSKRTTKKTFSLLKSKHQMLYNTKRDIIHSQDKNNGENFGGKNVIHAKIKRSH